MGLRQTVTLLIWIDGEKPDKACEDGSQETFNRKFFL
jgi:hypothetical protein